MGIHTVQEFEQLQSTRRKSASATGAPIHRKLPSSQAPAADAMADSEPGSSSEGAGEEEEDQQSEEGDSDEEEDGKIAAGNEDARHQAMLAEVRGAVGDRKRKRTAIATEAYPDSEYNLPPTSGPAGTQALTSMSKPIALQCEHIATFSIGSLSMKHQLHQDSAILDCNSPSFPGRWPSQHSISIYYITSELHYVSHCVIFVVSLYTMSYEGAESSVLSCTASTSKLPTYLSQETWQIPFNC